MFWRSIAVIGLLALAACANPYERFYTPNPVTLVGTVGFVPFSGEPRVVGGSGDPQRDIRNMYEEGYGFLGVSSFTGPAQREAGAVVQGQKVGAAVIVVSRQYRNTVSGAMPLTLPTTTTSYSSGTVNAFGSNGGFATGNYSGLTTTNGTQTTYIPYSVDKFEQTALYFAPLQRKGFGVLIAKMTDDQRRAYGTNQGMQVLTVRKGSPAFSADIVPGDILLTVDRRGVFDLPSAHAALVAATGHSVDVVLLRNGNRIEKRVTVPPDTW